MRDGAASVCGAVSHERVRSAVAGRVCRAARVLDFDEVPEDHPVARRHRLTVALPELADEVWTTGHRGTPWEGMTNRTCRQLGGFDPNVRHRTNDAVVSLALVAQGLAVTLLPDFVGPAAHPGVVVRTIAEGPVQRTIFAATRTADAQRPSVRALLAAVRSAATGLGWQT